MPAAPRIAVAISLLFIVRTSLVWPENFPEKLQRPRIVAPFKALRHKDQIGIHAFPIGGILTTISVWPSPRPTIDIEVHYRGKPMPLSGEAIRLMNYIDDVAVTLRRILAAAPTLTVEERTRVADHLLAAKPNADDVAKALNAK